MKSGGLVTVGLALQTWPGGTIDVTGGGRVLVGLGDVDALPNDTIWIGTNGTVSGNGTMLGNVVANGGTVQPGSSIGTLDISGSLALSGRVVMEINKTNSVSSDLIRAGSILFGGTLVVTNIGSALLSGDIFKLFDTASATGQFTNAQLPALSSGLGWDLSGLSSNGTIRVASLQTSPRIVSVLFMGQTNLQFVVPSLTGAKYVLETATNLSAPISWRRAMTNNGSGYLLPFQNRTDSAPALFYRIAVQP